MDKHLGIGIAIFDWDNLILVFENELFSKWISANEGHNSLANRSPKINIERLKNRLSKGRDYNLEHEIKDGNRKKILNLVFIKVLEMESSVILIKVIDYTKEKELEYMIDSYAKIAERNKRDLEKALQTTQKQNDRMQSELEIARQVQMGMLPFNFNPRNDNVEFAALLKPAKEVGGDFFDIFYIDENNLCICLGDVSDKGAGSALFMAATKTLIKSHAMNARSVAGIVSRVNNELAYNNEKCMFSTLFIGVFNLKSGNLLYSNCGHCYPLLLNKNKRIKRLDKLNGPALGIIEKYSFTEQQIKISKNQSLLIFSDGVTESFNNLGELYGERRLVSLLSIENNDLAPKETINLVFDSVVEFEKGTPQSDDITLMGIKYLG
ncbi:MAG: sigma-B regulation protein RsbU (phosphoserine phosphatase) [Saprospiraceae bacterium]